MDLRTRIIITSDDRSRPGFNSAREGLAQLERQITQARYALLGLFGISVGSGLVKSLIETADEFKQLNAAIKLSTRSEAEFNRAQQELFNISQKFATGLRDNVDLFRRVSASVRDMGGDQERAFHLIELIDKSVALSGVSAETAAAGIQQFNQGLGSGVLRGEEFNSVMENTPRLAQALADGLQSTKGELRSMAEQGKLTSEVVLKTLESQAGALDTEFRQVPQTVGAALVRVQNAWTVFLGQLNEGSGATAQIAAAFNKLADNMQQAVETGLALAKIVAGIWAAKTITSITTASAAIVQNAIAQREAAAASQLLMQQEIRRAEVSAAGSLNLIREAQLQRSLATTEAQRVAAMRALDAAYAKHEANVAALQARQAALNATLRQGSINTLLFGDAVGTLSKSMALLNRAFTAFIAFEIGTAVGEWLRQFEKIRQAGSYVAEAFTLIVTGFQAMFKGLSMQERFDQVKRIHEEFNAIRAADTEAARTASQGAAQAEEAKAKAAEEAAERQRQAWKQVEDGLKALTGSIDADAAQQNAILQQRLAERMAAIDASNAGELQKDSERTQALIQSAQTELELARNTADAKLQLVYQSYGAQIQNLNTYNETARQLDREGIEARKGIYSELATHYQNVVDQLAQAHQQEVQAALSAGQQIQNLALQHQFDLADIERQGVGAREKIKSEESEFDQLLADVAAERAKGKAADQELINGKLQRASQLNRDISQSTISLAQTDSEKSDARSANADRLNRLYAAQKTALEDNKKAHEQNAQKLADAQQNAADKLADVNTKLGQITEYLNKQYALQITADTSAIDAAIDKINSIPSEKTVVIRTVNEGEAAQTANRYGGLIPAFAGGGFAPKSGKLQGYGGGDKIRALLEAGEFIVRKEAVQKFGVPALEAINRGQLPIQRASGGLVGGEASERERRIIEQILGNLPRLAQKPNNIGSDIFDPRLAMANAEKILRQNNLLQFKDRLNAIIQNSFGKLTLRTEREKTMDRERVDRLANLKAHLFDAPERSSGKSSSGFNLRVPIPQLPKLSIPAPSLPLFNGPSASAPAGAGSETVTLRFVAPGGSSVAGQFGKNDAETMLRILKEAGAVTQ
jgi:tape measure domain-containing protein